jgi:hypothetical protein
VFGNALYNENFDMDQPTTCPNIYKGALHGIINPLFEDQSDLVVEGCVDLSCDSLSVCCKKSDDSFLDCDNDYDFNPLVGEVPDRQNFDDQPALHGKFFDDCSSIFTSASYVWEYSSKQSCGMQEPVYIIGYQFVPEYAIGHFYSEQFLDGVSSPLHCEDDQGFFLLPVLVIKGVFDVGLRDETKNFSLPLMFVTENHVFDRGKYSL